jgi:transcriptional regulator with XRE-family HTH domain
VDQQIGDRIAAVRIARRLTQEQLAACAHVSLSTLRKAEQGTRRVTDRTLEAIAEALRTSPDTLAGKRAQTDSRVHGAIPAIRIAIDGYDLPDDGPVRPVHQLQAAVNTATQQRLASQYARLAETAPPLLTELTRALQGEGAIEHREVARLLAVAYRAVDAVAYKYGYYDLSARLVELMRWAARQAEDPVLDLVAAYVRTEVFFASHNLAAGLKAIEHALDHIPGVVSIAEQAAIGALHMRAAVTAARLTEDSNTVTEHLQAARRLAEKVPEGIYSGTAFGPASLRVHEVSVAVELGDAAQAVETAGAWKPPESTPAERRSHFHIDMARAQLWLGLREEAFASLREARRIAPQHVREHPYVRDAILTLLRLHSTPPYTLVSFAEWARSV